MKRAILLLLASSATFVVVAVAGGQSVSACSCVSLTDQEAFDQADVVFTGTLVEIVTPPGDAYASTDLERFVFDVERIYKGEAVDPQTIVTARDGASCGLEIQGPGPFLVYATSSEGIVIGAVDGEHSSNLCSGTRAVADGAMPTSFGNGRPPTAVAPSGDSGEAAAPEGPERPSNAASSTSDTSDTSSVPWTLIAVVGVAAVALAASLIIRHQRATHAAL